MGDFSKDVMMIAALHESSDIHSDRLLLAAKNLCNAFGDFLKLVEPESNEVSFFFFFLIFLIFLYECYFSHVKTCLAQLVRLVRHLMM